MTTASILPTSTRGWVVQNHVTNEVDLSDSPAATFALKELPLPSTLPTDSLLVQVLYLSNDPGQRYWIQAGSSAMARNRSDMSAIPIATPMHSFGIARVIAVGGNEKEDIHVGDLISARLTWQEYSVIEKSKAEKLTPISGLSPSVFLGALGITGQTAYWCLVDTLEIKPTDTLVVSGAAGATGNIVVQYAKKVLDVQRVIAIAGSEQKCRWLESIGADVAVNYKSPTFAQDLQKASPKGVDKYFDNVGGAILDEVIANMNPHGIVGICGMMDSINSGLELKLRNYGALLLNRLILKGYTVMDYVPRFPEADKALRDAIAKSKLVVEGAETLVDLRGKFQDVPRVWKGLFEGANTGKLITKLAD